MAAKMPLKDDSIKILKYMLLLYMLFYILEKGRTFIYVYQIRKILSAVVELRIDHKFRCTDSRTERQLSEKINGFPFQRKEGVVVWRGRRLGCMGGVWQQMVII